MTEPVCRFTCPVCPSTNNLFVTRRDGKGRAKTTAYTVWTNTARWHVFAQRPRPTQGPVRVLVEAPFNRRRDIDNIKPVLDLLGKNGLSLIEDDRWIDDLRIVRTAPGDLMTISIWPM